LASFGGILAGPSSQNTLDLGVFDDKSYLFALRHTLLAGGPVPHGHARLMHAVGVAGYKRMPPIKIPPLADKTIGATIRQPVQCLDGIGRNDNAIRDASVPVVIVRTPAGADIQKLAAQARMQQFVGVFVLKFDQTALTAPVAERLPLGIAKIMQRFVPPKLVVVSAQDANSRL